jgi:ppGpp synthetase/RelA/SpoT-type nucleotidyltranferase
VAKSNLNSQEFVREQCGIFIKTRKRFETLGGIVKATLEHAVAHLYGPPLVQFRTKGISSFAEKCLRKKEKYHQPAWQLTDLCGVRVVFQSQDQIKSIRDFIVETFEVDMANSEDLSDRLASREFGYRSVHFIVSLKPDGKYVVPDGNRIPKDLFLRRDAVEADAAALPPGPVYKAEIQLKTLVQHAWASLFHDNLYKSDLKKRPQHLERESARIAALLEDADDSFVRFLDSFEEYRSYYGAYMTNQEIMTEIGVQRAVLSQVPGNEAVALKICQLMYNHGGMEREIVETLNPFENSENAAILRERGKALWKLGEHGRGRKALEDATTFNPSDVDAWCDLGATYYQKKEIWDAIRCYERAYAVEPDCPRAVLRYIECRILDSGDVNFISMLRPSLEDAIRASNKRIQAGMHLPWAWYDIGFFELFLGHPYRSLDAFGKGLVMSRSDELPRAVHQSLTEIHKKLIGGGQNLLRGGEELIQSLKWTRSLIAVALAARFGADRSGLIHGLDSRLDGRGALTTTDAGGPPFRREDSAVIVAGSCDDPFESEAGDYGKLLQHGLTGFDGVVCSGGTTAGISGVVGDLKRLGRNAARLGYLPSGIPRSDKEHPAYRIRPTTKQGYSPMDAIMLWADLLAAGIDPKSVRLLGIGGGEIAGFEYRLGVVAGAQVAVLPASSRAAAEIAKDDSWIAAGLLSMPRDKECLRDFLQPSRKPTLLTPQKREAMAKYVHEEFLKEIQAYQKDSRAPWESLADTFKLSNYRQVDHIETKLRRLNLTIRKSKPSARPAIYKFKPREIETLAEMEHGRWVVERLKDGWTYGKERDDKKKVRPQLIPWHDLPESEKLKDVQAVGKIPALLAEHGFEIVKSK